MIITDVILPTTIVDQMAAKTMVISQNAAQKMNQEYEMLSLKQQEEIETLRQRKKEDREKEIQSGDQRVNEIQVPGLPKRKKNPPPNVNYCTPPLSLDSFPQLLRHGRNTLTVSPAHRSWRVSRAGFRV